MKIRNIVSSAAIVALLVTSVAFPQSAEALAPPTGFQIQTLVSGLNLPTTMAFAPDGRIFIAQKDGGVRLVKNGALVGTPVITLSDVNNAGDHGLLGLALDPNFSSNGFMYLAYTYENSPGNYWGPKTGRIVRVTVVGDTASESSKVVILGKNGGNASQPSCDNLGITTDCIPSDSPSHSVGGLRFGPDGYLYAALGDGAGFENVDPRAYNAQNLDALTGKYVRIKTDGTAPTDNPFYNGNANANRSKVWAYGFRNAYKFNFRPGNNALFAGEVGWKMYEEINVVVKGGNYGWPCREGYIQQPEYSCTAANYIDPIYVYDHGPGTAAVTGGAFPTTTAYPEPYRSSYFFGDVTQNKMMRMTMSGNSSAGVVDFFDNAMGPVEIMTGPDGYIYYLAIYNGELRKLNYNTGGNNAPTAQIGGTPDNGPAPLAVQFSSAGSSDPDGDTLTYAWNFGDSQTSTAQNPQHTYTTNGTYTASLTVSDGKGGTNTKTMTIRVGTFTGNANPKHQTSSVAPNPSVIGRDVVLTTTIKNEGGSDPFVVDLEIYNAAGTKVAQKVFENESLATNATKNYDLTWFPSDIGSYRVAVGLFRAGWAGLYQWTDQATTFLVENRAPGTTTPPTGPFKPVHQSTAASNQTPASGAATTITTSVKNDGGAGSALIDIEIYKDGTKVGQKFFDNQSFAANETKSFTYDWTNAGVGTYKVSVGLFGQGWAPLHSWNADVYTITVSGTTPPPSGAITAFTDSSLNSGWANWSWGTTMSMTNEMFVTHNSAWAGLYLHTNPVSTSGKTALNFDINGGSTGNQGLQVYMYDESGATLTKKSLNSYIPGGVLGVETWRNVNIPLSDLNAANKTIQGFVIQDAQGKAQGQYRLDNIKIQ